MTKIRDLKATMQLQRVAPLKSPHFDSSSELLQTELDWTCSYFGRTATVRRALGDSHCAVVKKTTEQCVASCELALPLCSHLHICLHIAGERDMAGYSIVRYSHMHSCHSNCCTRMGGRVCIVSYA